MNIYWFLLGMTTIVVVGLVVLVSITQKHKDSDG